MQNLNRYKCGFEAVPPVYFPLQQCLSVDVAMENAAEKYPEKDSFSECAATTSAEIFCISVDSASLED